MTVFVCFFFLGGGGGNYLYNITLYNTSGSPVWLVKSAHIIVQQLNCFTVFTPVTHFWQRFSDSFSRLHCYASRWRQATVFMSHLSHSVNWFIISTVFISESFELLTQLINSKWINSSTNTTWLVSSGFVQNSFCFRSKQTQLAILCLKCMLLSILSYCIKAMSDLFRLVRVSSKIWLHVLTFHSVHENTSNITKKLIQQCCITQYCIMDEFQLIEMWEDACPTRRNVHNFHHISLFKCA